MRNVSTALIEEANSQQTEVVFVHLLTITSPSLTEVIRICDDPNQLLPVAGVRGVISRGNEFIFLPFQFSLPNDDSTGVGKARISIDNVDRRIVQAIRQAGSEISLKVEIVTSLDFDSPEISLDNFSLTGIGYDALTVTGEVIVQYSDTEPFPFARFTPSRFTGLF